MSSSANIRRHCLLCGATSFKHIFGEKQFLIKCKSCGLVSTEEIPSAEQLKEYYDEYPSYEEISLLTLQRYNKILDRLEEYRSTNNLLETGCGFGFFLEEARKRKWNVYGTEYSEKSINECKRKNIHISETLDKIPDNVNHHFDVIVSMEVIEHLIDPQKEIEKYSEILRPQGVLYITTPNFNSFSRRLYGSKWNVIIYPEHLQYFSSRTINELMQKNNFNKIYNQTSGFSAGRLVYAMRSGKGDNNNELSNYDYNGKDRSISDSIEKNVFLRFIKNIINSILSLSNSGDTLKILYQKK